MKYSHFEIMAFVLGSAAIVASIFVPSTAQAIPAEVVAQLLLILVLAGALQWGRNGGFVTALIAIAIYVGMRYPQLSVEGLSADVVTMIVSRAIGYAIVGVAGGELAGRIKYFLTRVERDTMIDPATGVYSGCYAGRAIAAAMGKHRRYDASCSVLTFTILPAVWSPLKATRLNALMRRVASHIRNDVRLVDDVAYRDNGGFIVILPETDGPGATAVAKRLSSGVAGLIGCETTELVTRVLVCGVDDAALEELADALAPADEPCDEPLKESGRRTTDREPERA